MTLVEVLCSQTNNSPTNAYYCIQQSVQGEDFHGLHRFSLNDKSFPTNFGLVDQQYQHANMKYF